MESFPCFLLKKGSEFAQSCPTLCDPWTVAHQAPPSMGFSKQESWSRFPFPSPGDLPKGLNPGLLYCRQMLYHLSHQELREIRKSKFRFLNVSFFNMIIASKTSVKVVICTQSSIPQF